MWLKWIYKADITLLLALPPCPYPFQGDSEPTSPKLLLDQ